MFDATPIKDRICFLDTATRKKEPFTPQHPPRVSLYTCGPTVYNFAHIGNFRTYIFEDLLRRSLTFFGYHVHQVMNITDVDDKTIRGATQEGKTLKEYTDPYQAAFFHDLDVLGIERAQDYPAATDYIPQMITFIQDLIDKGAAYQGSDGSVYFSISSFPKYGCLSNLVLDDLETGASDRVESDEYDKDHVADFVVWKAYDPERDGTIYWESPFGKGRPGWHLECSTMATQILGQTIDIHAGGVDNIFPHHENEIAQSEVHTGERFVKTWLHSEHLIVEGKKMSKSLGNFYTLRDLLEKGYSGMQIRYLLLQTHYRTQLNFTFEGLEAAKASLQRLHDFKMRMEEISDGTETTSEHLGTLLGEAHRHFAEALADDLNISQALAVLFDLIREVNSRADRRELLGGDATMTLRLLQLFDQILGVLEAPEESVPEEIEQMVAARQMARKERDFDKADALRDAIYAAGWVLEDTAAGARVKRG